jgi:hypothetical protein
MNDLASTANRLAIDLTQQLLPLVFRGVNWRCWRCGASSLAVIALHVDGYADIDGTVAAVEGDALDYVRERLSVTGDPLAEAIKPRWSQSLRSRYLSNGCAHCDALFGAWPLNEKLANVLASDAIESLPVVSVQSRPALEWLLLYSQARNLLDY